MISLVLLSTVVSEEILLNSTLHDINSTDINSTELVETEEVSSVQLMHLPFANDLRKPCVSESAHNRPTFIITEHRASFIVELFKIISHYASVYQRDAQEVLRNVSTKYHLCAE